MSFSPSQIVQEKQPAQHNFSVHKHNRYRWQKRVLQVSLGAKQESNHNLFRGLKKKHLW